MKKTFTITMLLTAAAVVAGAQQVQQDTLAYGTGVYTNPAMLLQSKISGVRVSATDGGPAGQINTNIRGLNSVRGVSEPLWIVDGAVLSSSVGEAFQVFSQYGDYAYTTPVSQMEGWNLYDIESIEVLKNTSATALYGARGANGVIIIKTKMPASEAFSKELHVNAGVNLSAQSGEGLTPAVVQNYSLALGSSSARTRYRFSAFYRDSKGVVTNSDNQAFGMRAMFDTKTNKVVWFGLNAAISITSAATPTGAAWYGAPSNTLSLRGIAPLSYNDPTGVTSLDGWAADHDDDTKGFRTTADFYLTLNFTPSLSWTNTISFDLQNTDRYIWYGDATAFGAQYNRAAAATFSSLFCLDYRSELKYEHYFGQKHHFLASGIFETVADWNKYNLMNGVNFAIPDMRAKGINLKESVVVPMYYPKELSSLAGLLHLSYDYDKKFGIDASGRYEVNTRYDSGMAFADNLYPAASAWVDLHRIAFADAKGVSSLLIEGGWGRAGRNRYIPYGMLSSFASSYPEVETDYQAFYEGYNRVRSTEWNVGVKAGFIQDRLTLALAYYDKSTVDALNLYCYGEQGKKTVGVWVETERQDFWDQSSSISNRGFELDLSADIIRTSKVRWTLDANAAYNINKVVSVGGSDERGYLLNTYKMYATVNSVGSGVSAIYGYVTDENNNVVGEGILGDTLPKLTAGISTTLKVGGFSLELVGGGAFGFDILNLNRLLASGQEYVSQPFVEKGDYFRLSRATAGYDIPVKSKWLHTLSVHLTGTNLLTATSYSGWNPDVNSFGFTNLATGIDYGSFPLQRTVLLGVTANF